MDQKMDGECHVCKSLFPSFVDTYDGKVGEILRLYSEEMSMLVFVLSGSINLFTSFPYIKGHMKIDKKGFFLSPMGEENGIQSLTNDTKLLIYKFNPDTFYCIRYFLNQLNAPTDKPKVQNIYVLHLNNPLHEYLISLHQLLKIKKYCSHFYDMMAEEIIIFLNEFYSKKELSALFSPILGHDSEFKSFVYANYRKVNNVKELAEQKSMTMVTFNRHFIRAFGVSAANWIRERKKEEIKRDIMLTDLSFTELAFKYNFSSSAYFTIFCKNNWGKPPSELRFNQE